MPTFFACRKRGFGNALPARPCVSIRSPVTKQATLCPVTAADSQRSPHPQVQRSCAGFEDDPWHQPQLQKRRAEVLEKLYKACLVGSDADFTCEHQPLQHFGTACLLYLVSTGSIADICVGCPSSVLTGRDTTSWSCRRAVALYTTGLPRGHKAQSEKQNKLREAVGHLRTPNFRRILKSQRSFTDAAHVCSHVQTWPSSPGRPPHPLTQPGGRNGAVT